MKINHHLNPLLTSLNELLIISQSTMSSHNLPSHNLPSHLTIRFVEEVEVRLSSPILSYFNSLSIIYGKLEHTFTPPPDSDIISPPSHHQQYHDQNEDEMVDGEMKSSSYLNEEEEKTHHNTHDSVDLLFGSNDDNNNDQQPSSTTISFESGPSLSSSSFQSLWKEMEPTLISNFTTSQTNTPLSTSLANINITIVASGDQDDKVKVFAYFYLMSSHQEDQQPILLLIEHFKLSNQISINLKSNHKDAQTALDTLTKTLS